MFVPRVLCSLVPGSGDKRAGIPALGLAVPGTAVQLDSVDRLKARLWFGRKSCCRFCGDGGRGRGGGVGGGRNAFPQAGAVAEVGLEPRCDLQNLKQRFPSGKGTAGHMLLGGGGDGGRATHQG